VSVTDGHDDFRISSFSGGGNCVAVAIGAKVLVRRSDPPDGAALEFTRDEWDAFVKGVKNGEFDPAS